MTRYLISFDDGAMNDIPEEDWPGVGEASHAVVREAQEAGVWIFGGGVESQRASIVETDGTTVDGPYPESKAVIGGFSIIDVLLARGGARLGCQFLAGLPLRAGGPGDHERPARLSSGDQGHLTAGKMMVVFSHPV